MRTTSLLALRLPDGRLSFASYKDEAEKARILAWAKAHDARVESAPQQQACAMDKLL